MTKKIFLTIAMFLVMLIVFAQTGTGQQPALPGANNIPEAATDTLNIITEANETIQALTGLMPNIDRPDAEIVTVDDNEYILRKDMLTGWGILMTSSIPLTKHAMSSLMTVNKK